MTQHLEGRTNLVTSREEHWRPPRYVSVAGLKTELGSRLLRFFDLQAGTIWADLTRLLPGVAGTVVDVGCGLQPYRRLFGGSVHYIGIDYAQTREHFAFEAPDTIYYSGDRWPIDSASADFIFCTEALEHALDPQVFLLEMFRCLKPGGQVVLTIPFAARWHYVPHDYWRMTPSALDQLLRCAGLVDVAAYGRGNQLTVACYKGMAVGFSLLTPRPSQEAYKWLHRAVGLLGAPVVVALAVVANATMVFQGAVDFLGFTVTAKRPG